MRCNAMQINMPDFIEKYRPHLKFSQMGKITAILHNRSFLDYITCNLTTKGLFT